MLDDDEIKNMSTDDLWKHSVSLKNMLESRESIKDSPRFKRLQKNKIEVGINPAFSELKYKIELELLNRNKANV